MLTAERKRGMGWHRRRDVANGRVARGLVIREFSGARASAGRGWPAFADHDVKLAQARLSHRSGGFA